MRETIEEQNQHIGRLMEDLSAGRWNFQHPAGPAHPPARSPRGDGLLALAAQERLEGNPEWQVVSPAHFGIVNFRFAPARRRRTPPGTR